MAEGPLDAVFDHAPELNDMLHDLVASEDVLDALRAIADTPAPSQLSALTRGPAVAGLVQSWKLDGQPAVSTDRHRSGAVRIARSHARVRLIAHLDEISYLLHRHGPDGWELTPLCYHLATGPRPARVIRADADGSWAVVATGQVRSEGDRLLFAPDGESEAIGPGDRVALYSPVASTTEGQVTGSLDNAAGVVSVLFAARVLDALGLSYDVLLPDEEEGPAGTASQTISRGATRALRDLEPADLTVVVDTHGLPPGLPTEQAGHVQPWGASLAEFSSSARGSVTPPGIYRWLHDAARQLERHGVAVRPNSGGYVPRSDDVIAMLHSRAVALIGYPGSNRHFDHGLPVSHLSDLVDLARTLAVIAAAIELTDELPG